MCLVKKPLIDFSAGSPQPPFELNREDAVGTLSINIEPYLLTADADCGSLSYSASVTDGYDPFVAGNAFIEGSNLVFENFIDYDEGAMTVQVEIK